MYIDNPRIGIEPLSSAVHILPKIYTVCHLFGIKELLDEGKCLLAVLVDVLLVRVGVIAVAAVRIGAVAVRLDDLGVGRSALEAASAWRELYIRKILARTAVVGNTYALGLAGTDIVRKTVNVMGVSHEDGSLDGGKSCASKSGSGTTAEGVVEDLATLLQAVSH